MEDIKNFIEQFDDIDMDNPFTVQLLAENYRKWLRWNKTYEDVEVLIPENFRTIVVIHNFAPELRIINSWEFLEDVKYYLTEYVNNEMDDEELHDEYYYDVVDFWAYPIQKLLEN